MLAHWHGRLTWQALACKGKFGLTAICGLLVLTVDMDVDLIVIWVQLKAEEAPALAVLGHKLLLPGLAVRHLPHLF